MAEKEERIGITKFKETETPDFELCAYHLITRTEAIERMVLAMHNEDIKRSIKDLPCDYNHLAEAALNALLSKEVEMC